MTFYFIYDHDSNINIYKMKWRVEAIIKMTLVTASLNKDNYRGKQETHKPYEKYISLKITFLLNFLFFGNGEYLEASFLSLSFLLACTYQKFYHLEDPLLQKFSWV